MKEAGAKGELDLNALGDKIRARQAELYEEIIDSGEVGDTDEAVVEEIPAA